MTYETVLLRDRRQLHSRAALWLTAQAGDRIDEYVDTIAEHHRLAGEMEAAAAFLERSARAALDRGLTAAARRSYEGAIAMWSGAGRDPPVLALVGLGDACSRAGDIDAAGAALDIALARAVLTDELVEALLVARRIAGDRGDVDGERSMIERALTIADPNDGITRAKLLNALAGWELNHGDLDESERLARDALALAEGDSSLEQRSTATRCLGHVAASRGDLDGAVRHLALAVDLARSGIDLTLQAIVRGDLGVALHIRGDKTGRTEDYIASIEQYERDLAVREQLGERRGLVSTRANLAQALLRLVARPAPGPDPRELRRPADLRVLSELLLSLQVEADRRLTEGDVDGGLAILVQSGPTRRALVPIVRRSTGSCHVRLSTRRRSTWAPGPVPPMSSMHWWLSSSPNCSSDHERYSAVDL